MNFKGNSETKTKTITRRLELSGIPIEEWTLADTEDVLKEGKAE